MPCGTQDDRALSRIGKRITKQKKKKTSRACQTHAKKKGGVSDLSSCLLCRLACGFLEPQAGGWAHAGKSRWCACAEAYSERVGQPSSPTNKWGRISSEAHVAHTTVCRSIGKQRETEPVLIGACPNQDNEFERRELSSPARQTVVGACFAVRMTLAEDARARLARKWVRTRERGPR